MAGVLHAEESPGTRNSLQFVFAPVIELDV
jgi:hypothetical protein